MRINQISPSLLANNYNCLKDKKNFKQTDSACPLSFSNNIIDFNQFCSMRPNIFSKDARELYDFFIEGGYDFTLEQAKSAIAKYRADAVELKPQFERAQKALAEFESKIQKADFSSLASVVNIFGNQEVNCDGQNLPYDDFTPQISMNIKRNMADMYAEILINNFPEYDIEIADINDYRSLNSMGQISVEKGDDTLLFFYGDFIESLQNGKLADNVNVMLSTPDNNGYFYLYESNEGLLSKVNKLNNEAVGIISKDAYSEDGQPIFYIDDCIASGPSYYALAETMIPEENDEETDFDDSGDYDEEFLQTLKNLINDDVQIKRYYVEYGLDFVATCMKNGKFNTQIALASAYLIDTAKISAKNGQYSKTYINDIVDSIKDKDGRIDANLLAIAQEFLSKEADSKDDYHEVILNALNYINQNRSYNAYIFGENLSDEFLSFEEINMVLNILKSYPKQTQKKLISKFNEMAVKYDVPEEQRPQTGLYKEFFQFVNQI